MHCTNELFTYLCIFNSPIHVQLDELVEFIKFSMIQNQNKKNTNFVDWWGSHSNQILDRVGLLGVADAAIKMDVVVPLFYP